MTMVILYALHPGDFSIIIYVLMKNKDINNGFVHVDVSEILLVNSIVFLFQDLEEYGSDFLQNRNTVNR